MVVGYHHFRKLPNRDEHKKQIFELPPPSSWLTRFQTPRLVKRIFLPTSVVLLEGKLQEESVDGRKVSKLPVDVFLKEKIINKS